MTDIEQKALALVNAVRASFAGGTPIDDLDDAMTHEALDALIRAIEQHEAFRREVSDACNAVWDLDTFGREQVKRHLSRFIIAKPDPLVEAWIEATGNTVGMEPLNAAIEKRGGKIVWGEG